MRFSQKQNTNSEEIVRLPFTKRTKASSGTLSPLVEKEAQNKTSVISFVSLFIALVSLITSIYFSWQASTRYFAAERFQVKSSAVQNIRDVSFKNHLNIQVLFSDACTLYEMNDKLYEQKPSQKRDAQLTDYFENVETRRENLLNALIKFKYNSELLSWLDDGDAVALASTSVSRILDDYVIKLRTLDFSHFFDVMEAYEYSLLNWVLKDWMDAEIANFYIQPRAKPSPFDFASTLNDYSRHIVGVTKDDPMGGSFNNNNECKKAFQEARNRLEPIMHRFNKEYSSFSSSPN